MKIRTRTHTVNSVEIDGKELEVEFKPYDEDSILAQEVGDKLVVAYLVQDNFPENPMKDSDAQGDIYTMDDRSITDNAAAIYRALGVDSYGNVEIDDEFRCEPYIDWAGIQQKNKSLRDIAAEQVLEVVAQDFGLIAEWLEYEDYELDENETLDQAFTQLRCKIWQDNCDSRGLFSEAVEKLAIELYPTYWKKIAGPFVVPLYYSSCGYGTTITLNEWDGDPDDLPNCIWVADSGAEENITPYPDGVSMKQVTPYPEGIYGVFKDGTEIYQGKWSDCKLYIKKNLPEPNEENLREAAAKYAEAVTTEYAAWCSGDVYGCVTQIYTKVFADDGEDLDDFTWVAEDDHEACWGFICESYAMETLKSEYFEGVIERLKKESSNG